jgi:hypothetical protein
MKGVSPVSDTGQTDEITPSQVLPYTGVNARQIRVARLHPTAVVNGDRPISNDDTGE